MINYQKMGSNSKLLRQQGFTLLELVIVLALISMLAGLSILAYDGSRGKGIALYSKLTQYGDAFKRMRVDTQCYPKNSAALFDSSTAGESYCGIDLQQNWKGPYTESTQVVGANVALQDFGPTAELVIPDRGVNADMTGSGASNRFQWGVVANNIPSDIVNVVMEECNNGFTDDTKTEFKSGQCFILDAPASSGTALTGGARGFLLDGGLSNVGYIFDERR